MKTMTKNGKVVLAICEPQGGSGELATNFNRFLSGIERTYDLYEYNSRDKHPVKRICNIIHSVSVHTNIACIIAPPSCAQATRTAVKNAKRENPSLDVPIILYDGKTR